MKILGLIVAKSIDNDIPNKYTRTIAGYMQIEHVLFTLKNSKYNIEILFLSDIDDVRRVCDSYKIKNSNLDYKYNTDEYDLIINVKASSMNINAETLDKAIMYVLENNIKELHSSKDLFIIYNKNGIKDYETYEINTFEQYDLDDLKHLYYCDGDKYRVGYYTNGSNERGLGHIYRALDLADDFMLKPDIYYDINQTDESVFNNTIHKIIGVDGLNDLYHKCEENMYDIFITDTLATSDEYMNKLRHRMPNCIFVNFEDDGPGCKKADLVFNSLYDDSYLTNVFGGEKYYICDDSFLAVNPISINDEVKKVFICFGGADPANYTDRLLEIIANDEYKGYDFTVIIGGVKNNTEDIMKYNSYKNIHIYQNVKGILKYMIESDIAITSRGNVTYELAILGIPSVSIAQNENEEKHNFASIENEFLCLDKNPSSEKIKEALNKYLTMSKEERERINIALSKLDLKSGRKRIIKLIYSKIHNS